MNIRAKTSLARLSVGLATTLLVACGGGDPGNGTPVIGGIQGSGRMVSIGTITGFGSIFVNGVEFATSTAQITLDGRAGTEADLRIGQVVTVQGTVNANGTAGTATRVTFDNDVEGPVTQLDVAAGTFVVLGQTIRVTGSTHFDASIVPSRIEGLASAGIVVEVSGFVNAAGEITATRIERKAAGGELDVKGAVQALDTAARTFRINALTVDYATATVSGTLENGRVVEAEGAQLDAAGVLIATSVEVKSGIGAAADDDVELEGLITRFVSNADFDVSGQRVTTTTSTEFDLQGATLGVDVRVEVEGRLDANGVLVAREVEVEPDNTAGVAGLVDSVTAAGNALRVAGVDIATTAATQFEDKSALAVRPMRLADLRTGDYVEVRGTEPQGGGLAAAIIEREEPDDGTELRGIAGSVADPSFVLLGVTVTVDAGTEFRDLADQPITRAEFFAQAAGRIVEADGTLSGATLAAEEVGIED
ncbi:MAG: DUF5666 domain-containing protein [Steroidobacteraceae bacterium]